MHWTSWSVRVPHVAHRTAVLSLDKDGEREYVAECLCEWLGQVRKKVDDAYDDAAEHMRAQMRLVS